MATSYCAGVHTHALPGNHPRAQIWNGTRLAEINAKDSKDANLHSFPTGFRNNRNCSLSARENVRLCIYKKRIFRSRSSEFVCENGFFGSLSPNGHFNMTAEYLKNCSIHDISPANGVRWQILEKHICIELRTLIGS